MTKHGFSERRKSTCRRLLQQLADRGRETGKWNFAIRMTEEMPQGVPIDWLRTQYFSIVVDGVATADVDYQSLLAILLMSEKYAAIDPPLAEVPDFAEPTFSLEEEMRLLRRFPIQERDDPNKCLLLNEPKKP